MTGGDVSDTDGDSASDGVADTEGQSDTETGVVRGSATPKPTDEEPDVVEGSATQPSADGDGEDRSAVGTGPLDGADADRGDVPLSSLTDRLGERRAAQSTDGDSAAADELFDREDVTHIDSDRLWQRLEHEELPDPAPETSQNRREVSKQSYCHQCEHFSEPPVVGCENEGTTIVELASMETFVVADCPVVLEEEAMERS